MSNIHTIESLNASSSNSNILSINSVNEGTQLLPVLRLRASINEDNGVQSSLDKVVEEHRKYIEENGSSSISEDFPNFYPAINDVDVEVSSLFDIIKNIYNRIINSEVDIVDGNINTLSNLIRNDPCFATQEGCEDIKKELNTVVNDLNNSININSLKPLGQFGDITLNELILKGQNLDFVRSSFFINNHEFIVYPLKLIPIGLVYGTIVRLFMKHCDDYNSIIRERNVSLRRRTHLLRVRRVNIATTLAITAPIATILLLKFGSTKILDGIKIGGVSNNDTTVNNNELLYYISIITSSKLSLKHKVKRILPNYKPTFATATPRPTPTPTPTGKKKKNKNKKNQYPKIFKLIILIIIGVGLYKYNILPYINKDIIKYFIYYIWFTILIFTIVYNCIGYFILLLGNEKEIDIDLNKIRIKFIRNTIENFIVIGNNTTDKEKENMKKYFILHLYLSLFVFILSGFLI